MPASTWGAWRPSTGSMTNIDGMKTNPRFTYTLDTIMNCPVMAELVDRCDMIYHLAAAVGVRLIVESPVRTISTNIRGTEICLDMAAKKGKKVVIASTSEVYGACPDPEFKEDESFLVVGPIQKERWIYSCCKQLLDRVIYAYGTRGHLEFTLFRPFNWVGPRLDSLFAAKEGSSRVVTQFIAELLLKKPITLVDGGLQKRCFTYVDDGIEALVKILENRGDACKNQIINIGNPGNECSVKDLANLLKRLFMEHPEHRRDKTYSEIVEVPSETYYGRGYQDIYTRKPSIEKARRLLGWEPKVGMEESMKRTLYSFLEENRDFPAA